MKEKSNSKQKFYRKKLNNENYYNMNQFYPIKFFHYNAIKKIFNNKIQKSKKNINEIKKIKKEEEDDYNNSIYSKRILSPNLSFTNLRNKKFNNLFNKYNSTDERYKQIYKFGFYSKRIFFPSKKNNSNIIKCKFIKTNRIKTKNKIKLKKNNPFIDIHNINNINKNLIYRFNNIYKLCNTKSNNTISNKTNTNNTLSNCSISNIAPLTNFLNESNTNTNNNSNNFQNSSYFRDFNPSGKKKNINNIKVIKKKGKNSKEEKEIFIRRIILEEKYTIDSNGKRKTIYVKKISPSLKERDVENSADKRLIRNKSNNNKDIILINHKDINLKFHLNKSDKKYIVKTEFEKFYDNCKMKINNSRSINNNIRKNYKHLLNIKNENKSYQSLFRPKKRYYITLIEDNIDKNSTKTNKKIYKINNKQSPIKAIISNKIPIKYKLNDLKFTKDKMADKKIKIDNYLSYNNSSDKKNKSNNINSSKEKTPLFYLSLKHDISDSTSSIKSKNNINKFFMSSYKVSSTSSNNNSIKNSFKNTNIKIINKKKYNLYINVDNNNLRSKSLNKIVNNKNNRYMKLFIKYLKNNIIDDTEINKSHTNFVNQKIEKCNILNKISKINSKKRKCANYINIKKKEKKKNKKNNF